MSTLISPELLAQLGLDARQLGDISLWQSTADTQAQGGVADVLLAAFIAAFGTAQVQPVALPVAEAQGYTAYEAQLKSGQRFLGLCPNDGVMPQLRVVGDAETAEYEGTVWLLQRPKSAVAFERETGPGFIVIGDKQAVVEVLPLFDFERVVVDTSDWVSADAPRWLLAEFAALTEQGDAFGYAAAGGLALRHDLPPGSLAGLAQILAGEAPELDAVHRWFGKLTSPALADVQDLATAQAMSLRQEFEVLQEALDLDDANWQAAFADVCWRREVLDGVRGLLAWRNFGTTLTGVLRIFDEDGHAFTSALHRSPALTDARLQSVADVDPAAWWGAFAASDAGAHV